jgi:glutathione S-transferase
VIGKGPQRVVIASSHEILEFADKKIDVEEDRLYPSDPEQLQLVQSWESKFDDRLGPHVRRYAYSYLLFDPCSYKLLSQGASTTEKVDGALADGRPYICGSKFTAADLTFAALGGSLVAAPQIGCWLPKMDECPAEMATVMKRFQGTSAGQHILKVYETKRQRPEEKRVY